NFYFLEMNTRLQVEHPVTELITGVDLVEQMIRVAYGEELSIKQEDIGINGWAMESRIYAEDPFRNFLPSIGRLTRYRPPAEGTNSAGRTIRNDTGVFEGAEISMFYDPMIAKLCTHGATRDDAIAHMEQALDEFYIRGIGHNVPFLAAVMGHDRFRSGNITTGFIAEEYPDGFEGAVLNDVDREKLAALATYVALKNRARDRLISGRLSNDPLSLADDYVVAVEEDKIGVSVEQASGALEVKVGASGNLYRVQSDWVLGHGRFRGTVNGEIFTAQIDRTAAGFAISHGGATVEARVRTKRAAELADLMPYKAPPDTSKLLLCPMPGLIVSIDVEVGEQVFAGQTLAVVEAMKMENVLRAEKDGVVSVINAGPGDSLAVDEIILEFE
ncbi:MAG: biotin/lipoyl-containing protein, partial [Alphaproteobacteria bacterium]